MNLSRWHSCSYVKQFWMTEVILAISLWGVIFLYLIQKDSVTHIHKLVVFMKEGFPFAQNLSLQKSADSYLCFQLALLHSVSCFCLSITSLVFRWCYVRSGVVVSIRRIDSAKNRFYTKQSKIFFGPKNFHIWFFHYIYHVFWFFKKPWVKWMPAMKIL